MQHLVPLMINYNTVNAKSLAGNTINYPTEDTQPQVDTYLQPTQIHNIECVTYTHHPMFGEFNGCTHE